MDEIRDALPSLGQHCSLPDCKVLDFLPFVCQGCARIHCREHAAPSQHSCPFKTDNIASDGGSRFKDKFDDLLPDPKRRALDRDASQVEQQQKREDARAILAKNFGQDAVRSVSRSGSASRAPPIQGKGKASSPVILLMKLKQRAQPVDAKAKLLSMEDRLYLTIEHRRGSESAMISDRAVWLSKTCTVGKAIDQLAALFKLSNVNNVSKDPSKLLTLAQANGSAAPLKTSDPLAASVSNGDIVWLLQGAGPP